MKKLLCVFRLARLHREGSGADLKRVVTVQLYEACKVAHIVVFKAGAEENVVPSVLANIAEIAVSLRVVLAVDGEEIVITLGIAVLAAVQIEHSVAHGYGVASAKEIVKIALLHVLVESRVSCFGSYIRRKLLSDLIGHRKS